MSIDVRKPEEISSANFLKAGIYGFNGTGKTTLTATIDVPTLVVSADVENIKPYIEANARGGKFRVFKPTDWDGLLKVYMLLLRGKHPFEAVVFDTWTRMQGLAIYKITGYKPADEKEISKYIAKIPSTPKGYDNWQQVGALAAEWMSNFLRLPMHVVFLMQEQYREREEGDEKVGRIGPALTPWAQRAAMESLEMVGYLYVDIEEEAVETMDLDTATTPSRRTINPNAKEVRRLLLGHHPHYMSKGPTHKLGYVVTNPTWPALAAALS